MIVLGNLYPYLSFRVDLGGVAAEKTGLVVVTMAGLEELFAAAMTEGLELFVPRFQRKDSVVSCDKFPWWRWLRKYSRPFLGAFKNSL